MVMTAADRCMMCFDFFTHILLLARRTETACVTFRANYVLTYYDTSSTTVVVLLLSRSVVSSHTKAVYTCSQMANGGSEPCDKNLVWENVTYCSLQQSTVDAAAPTINFQCAKCESPYIVYSLSRWYYYCLQLSESV